MKIMVTGSNGYVGSLLVPQLLKAGHFVVGYDTQWFGNADLPEDDENLVLIKGDIRDLPTYSTAVGGCDAVINLACISNDTSCGLDEKLSTSVNYDAFEPLVVASKLMGVKRFIYCSSSSVYGVSDAPNITEDHPLVPLTLYNKYKGMCEPLLFKHMNDVFTCVVIRPATVCGYAPRQRFDLTVNILTNHAIQKGEMTIFGGKQKRPNLHIQDMCDVYDLLLNAPQDKVQGQIFNCGMQNMTLNEIATLVHSVVKEEMDIDASIQWKSSTDNRSYHINSDKIFNILGFKPKYSIQDAVRDLCKQFKAGNFSDSLTNPIYLNVQQLIKYGFENRPS